MMLSAQFDAGPTGQLSPSAHMPTQPRPGAGVDTPSVTKHAIRRYAERVLGVFVGDDLNDLDAYATLTDRGVDVASIRERLQSVCQIAVREGAIAVIADGVRVLLDGSSVVTCLPRQGYSFLRRVQ